MTIKHPQITPIKEPTSPRHQNEVNELEAKE
jgi:hypothetical protein